MNNAEWIKQINPEQRQDMLAKGLSPLNPSHIKKYLEEGGKVRASQAQILERVKSLIGEENFHSLGSGHEKEISFDPVSGKGLSGYDPDSLEREVHNISTDFSSASTRKDILGNYGTNREQVSSSSLLSLKEDFGNSVPKSNSGKDYSKYEDLGHKNTIKYLNDFIISLKQPETKNRINVFNSLKTVLQAEQQLKNNKEALQAYRKGCIKAERSMYVKLTS